MSRETPDPVDPNALPINTAAQLLNKAGGRQIAEATLRKDIDAGAPTNEDDTINLVHYGAWLVQQMSGGTDGD